MRDDDDMIIIGPEGEDAPVEIVREEVVYEVTDDDGLSAIAAAKRNRGKGAAAEGGKKPDEKSTDGRTAKDAKGRRAQKGDTAGYIEEDKSPGAGQTDRADDADDGSGLPDEKPVATSAADAPPRRKRRRKRPDQRWVDVIFGGDKVLWVIIIILLIFSMLLTFSATIYKTGGTPTSILVRQLVFIALGIAALLIVHIIRYQFYSRMASAIFITGFLLTLAAMFFGTEGADARRDLEMFGISFQPFEILKIGLIMVLAKQLASRQKNIMNTPIMPSLRPSSWKNDAQANVDIIREHSLPILGPIVVTCIVTFFSVGNSTTLIIFITCLVMLYIGRVRMADLGKILGIAAFFGLIFFAVGAARSDTGKSRMKSLKYDMYAKHARVNSEGVEVYWYPAVVDPSGRIIEPEEADQSINAKMSIASGKFFGKGPGMSTHRANLQEAEKDFAYAFIIEEYGAMGGLLILFLYLWLFFRTIQIFKRCGTAFPSLLVLGLGLMIVLQAMIHMLVSVALFPVTGQQLPLISKGGTSLVFTLTALGMILGVSRQTAEKTLDTPKDESLFEKN